LSIAQELNRFLSPVNNKLGLPEGIPPSFLLTSVLNPLLALLRPRGNRKSIHGGYLMNTTTDDDKTNFVLILLLLGGLTLMYLVDAELDRRENLITDDYIQKSRNFARNLNLIKGAK
jgi:hypothetical protein